LKTNKESMLNNIKKKIRWWLIYKLLWQMSLDEYRDLIYSIQPYRLWRLEQKYPSRNERRVVK